MTSEAAKLVIPFLAAAATASAALASASPALAVVQDDSHDVHFSSFDVGIGAVVPDGAELGLSYGTGVDIANLLLPGTTLRLGFRFWSTEDEAAGVDLDDGLLELLLKTHFQTGRLRGYAGIGFGVHFVSARRIADPEIEDERDGFHPGLQLLLGTEVALGEDGFLAAFVEGVGSVMSDVPHGIAQAGVRVRFDRLGGG